LLTYSGADDPAVQGPDCNLPLATAGGGTAQAPCSPGQDEATPCQYCSRLPAGPRRTACETPPQ
jgi:hypothetical protein